MQRSTYKRINFLCNALKSKFARNVKKTQRLKAAAKSTLMLCLQLDDVYWLPIIEISIKSIIGEIQKEIPILINIWYAYFFKLIAVNFPPTMRSKTIHKYMQILFSYLTSLKTSLSRIFIIPPFCWRQKILWTKATSLNFNVFSWKYPFCLIMLLMCT